MIIMAANAAGIAGSQVFRTGDAPLYIKAFTAMFCLATICVAVVIGQLAWYFLSNRRLAKSSATALVVSGKANGIEIEKVWKWSW